MFVSRKEYDMNTDYLEDRIRHIESRYWELWHKHQRILEHFGLQEREVPERTELCKKGGPERGDRE